MKLCCGDRADDGSLFASRVRQRDGYSAQTGQDDTTAATATASDLRWADRHVGCLKSGLKRRGEPWALWSTRGEICGGATREHGIHHHRRAAKERFQGVRTEQSSRLWCGSDASPAPLAQEVVQLRVVAVLELNLLVTRVDAVRLHVRASVVVVALRRRLQDPLPEPNFVLIVLELFHGSEVE
jgi:hypothetical protein